MRLALLQRGELCNGAVVLGSRYKQSGFEFDDGFSDCRSEHGRPSRLQENGKALAVEVALVKVAWRVRRYSVPLGEFSWWGIVGFRRTVAGAVLRVPKKKRNLASRYRCLLGGSHEKVISCRQFAGAVFNSDLCGRSGCSPRNGPI